MKFTRQYVKTSVGTLATVAILGFATTANARPWYVSGTGDDHHTGQSEAQAFATLQKAADSTGPGDTVYIMNGTYTAAGTGHYILAIRTSGTSNSWITYTNYPGHSPLIYTGANWCGIDVQSASYIKINGLSVQGNNDAVESGTNGWSPADALANEYNSLPQYGNHGIDIDYHWDNADHAHPHHISVTYCTVFKHGGSGIGASGADYITFEHNWVYQNAKYSPYAESGMGLLHQYNIDTSTATKNFIRYNMCNDNQNLIPNRNSSGGSTITDGNGIIIDSNTNSGPSDAYTGNTLIANNLVYNNGGSGIHSFLSAHVTMVNNTAYHNGSTPNLAGEIYARASSDVSVTNNIMYARDGKALNTLQSDTGVTYDYNLYFNNATGGELHQGPHDLRGNPQFVNAYDYHLLSSSPAIDMGTTVNAPNNDYAGTLRYQGSGVDIGAYESTYTNPVTGALAQRATGGTATASSNPVAAEAASYAFDGQNTTKWLGNMTSSGAWLQYQFSNAGYAITQYRIVSANDTANRHPKNWTLVGSNNGTTWSAPLDTQTNQSYDSQYTTKYYNFSNSTVYKYYRLQISANNGSTETNLGGTGLVQLAELQLLSK